MSLLSINSLTRACVAGCGMRYLRRCKKDRSDDPLRDQSNMNGSGSTKTSASTVGRGVNSKNCTARRRIMRMWLLDWGCRRWRE